MCVQTQPSAQSPFQKSNVDNSCQKTRKIRYYIFEALSNFIVFLYFVPSILSRIVACLHLEKFSPFPKTNKRFYRGRSIPLFFDVYCIYRKAYFNDDIKSGDGYLMANCSCCGE